MIYAYIRVSTDKQHQENQKYEIEQFASAKKMYVDKWIKETISSKKPLDERKLGKLIKKLKADDILITSEISRIGRNLLQIMSVLHHCMNVGCQVWTIKDNYRLGYDVQSKVLAFAFGLSAEIERNLISQRTKQCLARLRAEGKRIGRPKGRKNSITKLMGKEKLIENLLAQNIQKTKIAEMLKVNYSTLYMYLKQKAE